MSTPVIAIFDIGKTNKKVFLFDENYNVIFEKSEHFEETVDEDGDPCEDVTLFEQWMQSIFAELLSQKQFDVRAVNFATYGASFVFVDGDGKTLPPLYNYLKKFPEELLEKFYRKYGEQETISTQTASPALGSLNSGLQLYRLKHTQQEKFSRVKYALHLPQFVGFRFTGIPCSDMTSIGCHTSLWNFQTEAYHQWVVQEAIDSKLAPIVPSNSSNKVSLHGKLCNVGVGLHDSSAALIPYLLTFKEPFILISTGTWSISLNPFNQTSLSTDELAQDCLCYLQFTGKQVKASRLFAGHFHDVEVERISNYFNSQPDFYKSVKFSTALGNKFRQQSTTTHSNPALCLFSTRELKKFDSAAEAYVQLMSDLVCQQVASTRLVLRDSDVRNIHVDGGFCNNDLFMNFLAIAFEGKQVNAASLAQATALGAALAIHDAWNKKIIPKNLIHLKSYSFVKEHQS